MEAEKIIFSEIKYGGQEYDELVALRDKILRKPLGMHFTKEQLEQEASDYHLAGFYDNKIITGLVLTPFDDQIKMRQVAVDANFQGKGAGKRLVAFSEVFSRNKGFKKIFCNARDTAVDFYKSCGYQIIGEPFTEIGIKHYKMEKML